RTVERWNGGTVERWNGGTVERWNGGTVERHSNTIECIELHDFTEQSRQDRIWPRWNLRRVKNH
ncbi:hypothetical protein, partial [Ralstonia pseudosolanacearum]|uniref:hypothetical protein n=2 Tax=Ralstonia pseudosolanacearum TaxID=1310165 RepID=UPI002675DCAC